MRRRFLGLPVATVLGSEAAGSAVSHKTTCLIKWNSRRAMGQRFLGNNVPADFCYVKLVFFRIKSFSGHFRAAAVLTTVIDRNRHRNVFRVQKKG